MLMFVLSITVTFIIAVILGRIFIPVLKSIKMGQKILDIGPRWHKSKEGTPTMGGLFFIGAFAVSMLSFGIYASMKSGMLGALGVNCLFAALCAITGFIDDYVKFFKKQNEGLTPKQKLVFQFGSAAIYLAGLKLCGMLSTVIILPFCGISFDLGIFFYIIAIIGIVYVVNAVNLTDGIDGLCSCVTVVVMATLAVLAFMMKNDTALVFCGTVIGGLLGFLFYNFHPAKVFMGDTGSLFLGSTVVCACFMLGLPILIIFMGVVYICEALSVVIQVTSFKLTGKRVFKMSPIHHHFEMCGWGEVKICIVFSLVALIFAALGAAGYIVLL
ncbi:MAG: phospho-N-acetylmuramoyl-pentapeptide-transferase [Ruminococcaceae bacterium]|nr:phospho-N-acetylmuramoyl-pentapeptide-transferase [Oscillospiraceae bacterium]